MKYFDRTRKMSNILFCVAAGFFIITLFNGNALDQVLRYSNGDFVRAGIFFAITLAVSVMSLVLGIALRCIAKDAKEEFDSIFERIKDNKK